MKERLPSNGRMLNRESTSFATYAEAEQAAEEVTVAQGIPRRAVAVRPVGMRLAKDGTARAANDVVTGWIVVGVVVVGFIGVAFGLVNAISDVISRPWVVFATVVVVGVMIGAVGGVTAGAIAARRVTRDLAGEPLFRASRYTLVIDWDRAYRHKSANSKSARVVDVRDHTDQSTGHHAQPPTAHG